MNILKNNMELNECVLNNVNAGSPSDYTNTDYIVDFTSHIWELTLVEEGVVSPDKIDEVTKEVYKTMAKKGTLEGCKRSFKLASTSNDSKNSNK